MKDGGQTHKWNVNPQFLYVMLGILILIPIFFILSIWLNTHLYKEYRKATQNQIELQYIVDRNAQTIVRLNNLESFLRDYSPDLLGLLVSQAAVDTVKVPTIRGANEILAKELNEFARKKNFDANTKTQEIEEITTTKNKQDKVDEPLVIASKEISTEKTSTENIAKGKTPIEAVSAEEIPTDIITAKDIKQRIDLDYVTLTDVQIKLVANKLSIQYGLHNKGKNIPLAGKQLCTLINVKNGKILRTVLVNTSNNTFRIRNLKQVKSNAILSGLDVGKMARIQIDIVSDGRVLFRETYPINH